MNKSIRFILTLSVLFGIGSGLAYAYDADGNPNTKREIAGAPAFQAYREYKLVRFGENAPNATALSQGDVVIQDCVSDDAVSVAIIAASNSTDAVAGVVVSATIPTADVVGTSAQTDFGRRNWGYVQVKGLCTKVNIFSGPALAGGSLMAAPQLRCATAAVKLETAATTASYPKVMGFAYDANSTGNANEVYIDL